jgi:hypothetical protein
VNVSSAVPASAGEITRTTAVTQAVSAIVFREVLKPLAAALGPIGDTALESVVDRMLVQPPR